MIVQILLIRFVTDYVSNKPTRCFVFRGPSSEAFIIHKK